MRKALVMTAVLASMSLLGGCAHTISKYSPSFTNIKTLNHLAMRSGKVSLGAFVDPKHKRAIACRLEGNEYLPGRVTYATYLKSALQQELKSAGIYSPQAKNRLSAKLDKIDFSSMIGRGSWTIKMTFNDHHQAPYTVSSVYRYSTNFDADIACQQVAQAFVPAVQKFLNKLYHNPHFKKTLKGY